MWHKIIQKRGVSSERIPPNESTGIIEPRTPDVYHTLSDWYVWQFLPHWKFFVLECAVSQNRYLYKWKSLLKKLTMITYHSYLPFYCNSQEKQFLKGILGRKSHWLWSEAKLEPCKSSAMELLCEKSQQVKAATYFYKKLHHRCLTGF